MAAVAKQRDTKDVKLYNFSWTGKDKSGKTLRGEVRAGGEHLVLARSERAQRRGLLRPPVEDELLDHLRVDHRSAPGDLRDRGRELPTLAEPVLEQVAAAGRALLEQRECVLGVGVLAEDDHADGGMRLPQAPRDPDSLHPVRGRHPDVRQHHVRAVVFDRLHEALLVRRDRDDLYLARVSEHVQDPLAYQQVVVRDDDPNRHPRRVRLPCLTNLCQA